MLGTPELILILIVIVLLFIAPRRIIGVARSLGQGIRAFQKETKEIGIETTEQPLLVFVSSMMGELGDERQAICQAIQQIPLTKPWLFEFTPPSSEEVSDSYLNKVKECDIFLLVVGNSISLPVMREFELANINHKPCLVFLKDCERNEEAQSFVRSIVFKWAKFSTTEELTHLVQLGLIDELIRGYREGLQKKLSAEHLTILMALQELFRRGATENEEKTVAAFHTTNEVDLPKESTPPSTVAVNPFLDKKMLRPDQVVHESDMKKRGGKKYLVAKYPLDPGHIVKVPAKKNDKKGNL